MQIADVRYGRGRQERQAALLTARGSLVPTEAPKESFLLATALVRLNPGWWHHLAGTGSIVSEPDQ